MDQVTKYPHGCFSWVDLSSTDAAASKTFYSGLFGEIRPSGEICYAEIVFESRCTATNLVACD